MLLLLLLCSMINTGHSTRTYKQNNKPLEERMLKASNNAGHTQNNSHTLQIIIITMEDLVTHTPHGTLDI